MLVSGVDESQVPDTTPVEVAGTLARMKAEAVAADLTDASGLLLGCDSVLGFDGHILGKPDNPDDARGRWQRMRGRSGVLHTGHHLINMATGVAVNEVATTTVHFAEISDAEIDAYIATGEPLWVAGAFTIDGLGGPFVDRIEGDHGNVIGLSLPLLRRMCAQVGVPLVSLWRSTDGAE